MDPLSAMEAIVHKMSTELWAWHVPQQWACCALLCSDGRAVPFPHFILLQMHFEVGSISQSFSRSCTRYNILGVILQMKIRI